MMVALLALGSAPFSFHHDHHEEEHCEHAEGLNNVDGCHISIYHEGHKDEACEHKSHLTQEENYCEWCSLISPKRNKFKLPRIEAFAAVSEAAFNYKTPVANTATRVLSQKKGRAPPAILA